MADILFQVTNTIALFSWVLLIVFPYKSWSKKLLFTGVILGFSVLYSFLIIKDFNWSIFQYFSTLQGVTELFGDPLNIVVGWVHYLAFDLLVGLYIARDGEKKGIIQT